MAAPTYPKIEINSGVKVTSNKLLNLSLFAIGATEMLVDTTANFINTSWQPYRTSMQFAVADEGNAVIYAMFRNESKEMTPIVSSSIKVDTSVPELISLSINGGVSIVRAKEVLLNITARGVSYVKILGDISNPVTEWVPFKSQFNLILTPATGEKKIAVYLQNDTLFEVQGDIKCTYDPFVDIEPPRVSLFVINNKNAITYTKDVILNIQVTGATFMMLSEDDKFSDAIWEEYTTTKLFSLSDGYETKFVYARFRDNSGNTSSTEAYIDYLPSPSVTEDFKVIIIESMDLFSVKVAFNRELNLAGLGTSEYQISALNPNNYTITTVTGNTPLQVVEVKEVPSTNQMIVLKTMKQKPGKYKLVIGGIQDINGAQMLTKDKTVEFYGSQRLSNPPVPPTVISITYEDSPLLPSVSWLFNTAHVKETTKLIGVMNEENICSFGGINRDRLDGTHSTFFVAQQKLVSYVGQPAITTVGALQSFKEGRVDFVITGTDAQLISIDTLTGSLTFDRALTVYEIASGVYVSYHYEFTQESELIYEPLDEQTAFEVQIFEEGTNKLVVDSGVIERAVGFWTVPSYRKLVKGSKYYIQVRTLNAADEWSPLSAPRRYDIPAKDIVKPTVLYAYSVLDKYVNIVFSEPLNTEFAEIIGNYYIQGAFVIDSTGTGHDEGLQAFKATLLSDRKTIALTTASQDTITYKIYIENLRDTSDNIMDKMTVKFLGNSYSSEIPLYITYARSLNERTVEVLFNKPVTKSTAELVDNYTVFGLTVTRAVMMVESQDGGVELGKRVVLSTTEQDEKTYVLTAQNIQDAFGAYIIDKNAFDFLGKASTLDFTDLILVQASSLNPTQVELIFNKQIELSDAELVNNYFIQGLQIRTVTLQPDEQTVILNTYVQEALFYQVLVANIKDKYGNVILSKNATAFFKGTNNKDKVGPIVVKALSKDETHVDVIFDEPVEENTATNITNYAITKDLEVMAATLLPNRKIVSLVTSTQAITEYALTVSIMVTDPAGNNVQEGRRTVIFTANIINYGVDPSLFPAPGVRATKNSKWWMVIRENETGEISLSSGDIRFCDMDQLPDLLLHDHEWIPVLLFDSSGELISVDSAAPFSYVSTSDGDLQVVNRYDGIQTLQQHVNDASLHNVKNLDMPVMRNVTNLKVQKDALRVEGIGGDRDDIVSIRCTVVGSNGTALVGTSTVHVLDLTQIPSGTALYVDGDGADLVLNSGNFGLISRQGTIVFGNEDYPNTVYVTHSTNQGAAINSTNIDGQSDVNYDHVSENAIGVFGGVLPNARYGVMGDSRNYIGIIANGAIADVYLEHGTISSFDLKPGELIIDGVKITQNGKYA